MYKPKYFKAHEFLSEAEHNRNGGYYLNNIMDGRILAIADELRARYGSTTINNYKYGGIRRWSGIRTPDSEWYEPRSQHSFGRAIDCVFSGITAEEVRADIRKRGIEVFSHITDSVTIEDGVNWLHVDVRNNKKGVNFFNP